MKVIKNGITAPEGFLASAVNSGVKKSGKLDLALLFSEKPSICAGIFTTNSFKSGSCVVSEERIKNGISQAIVVNSGNANCCLGKREILNAENITGSVAKALNISKELVLIASTGIIGKSFPIGKITNKVTTLVKGLKRADDSMFSKAIMTTDAVHKEIAVSFKFGNRTVKIGGAVKGSGMICPDMATMLAFFTTDAVIEKNALKSAFKQAVDNSFNKITVDGDMSTNDSAFILANGLSGGKPIKKGSYGYLRFLKALEFVADELAQKIVFDGEGAAKFVEILVKGAKTKDDAEKVARKISTSNLVKTMIGGGDPNWGRIAASIGSSTVNIERRKVKIHFGNVIVMRNGAGVMVSRKILKGIFKKKKIKIVVNLCSGSQFSRILTCDLTKDYVEINTEYET